MMQKINFSSTLAALILFFLPWLSIQCSQKTIATQTGIQTIYGGASLSSDMDAMSKQSDAKESGKKDHIEISPLVGLAFLAAIAAFVFSIIALRSPASLAANLIGVAAATALLLLIIQSFIGFPIQKASKEKSTASEHQTNPQVSDIATAMVLDLHVSVRPWFYLEFLALAIPVLLLANKLADKRIKQNSELPS